MLRAVDCVGARVCDCPPQMGWDGYAFREHPGFDWEQSTAAFRSRWFFRMDSQDGQDTWMWGIPGFQLSLE